LIPANNTLGTITVSKIEGEVNKFSSNEKRVFLLTPPYYKCFLFL
jgi:hypothetical protein